MSLLPCPFCGGRGRPFGHPQWGVTCEGFQGGARGCGASVEGFLDQPDAIAAWNTRAPAATASPSSLGVSQEAIETGPSVGEVESIVRRAIGAYVKLFWHGHDDAEISGQDTAATEAARQIAQLCQKGGER